jgi:hypothetical protein
MIRAGVPQSVMISISGHRTVSMFIRYNITSGADKSTPYGRRRNTSRRSRKRRSKALSMPEREAASK